MKKNGKDRRVERVTLLLTEEEKDALEAHAQRTSESLTEAVRSVLAEKVRGFTPKATR